MSQDSVKNFASHLEPVAKASTLIGICLYASGFLIINSYLSQFGINDYNVISSRFIFSGASFAFVCVIWWVICGQLHFYKELVEFNFDRSNSNTAGFVYISSQAMLVIARSIAAALCIYFFMFADGIIVAPAFFITITLLGAEFGFSRSLKDNTSAMQTAVWARLLFSSASIIIFLLMFRFDEDIWKLLNRILAIEGIVIPVGEMIKNRSVLDFRPFLSIIYYIFISFICLTAYGIEFYGKISSKFGGGSNHKVHLNLKEPLNMDPFLNIGNTLISGDLIYASDKLVTVRTSKKILTISYDQVKASIIETSIDPITLYKMRKTVRRLGIPWSFDPFAATKTRNLDLTDILNVEHSNCYYTWSMTCGYLDLFRFENHLEHNDSKL